MNAKTLTVACVLIALTSGYFGQKLHAQAAATTRQAVAAKSDAEKARVAYDELQQVLKPDASTLTLDKAVSKALLDVYNLRAGAGVSVASVAPGRPGAAAVTDLATLSEKVPGTALDSLKVNIIGTYTTYEGLLAYVKQLQEGQVALTRLKVADRAFELSLRVYGTSN